MEKVLVDCVALQQVLEALNGPTHLIRELQATMNLPPLGDEDRNPINTLVSDYNAYASAHNEALETEH